MKFLASGWQYRVYDLGRGRVLKVKQSPFRQFFRIGKDTLLTDYFWPPAIFKKVSGAIRITESSRSGILERPYISQAMLGNPEYHSDGSYTQDKVRLIAEFLERATPREATDIFERYADFIIECWKYGLSDTVFNFTFNNGIDAAGNIMLIDIGEITFSRATVEFMISEKKWLKQNSYVWKLTREQQALFKSITDCKWTHEALAAAWDSKSPARTG